MQIVWTGKAIGDLARLHAFLAQVNPPAARAMLTQLRAGPRHLQVHPRLGERLREFAPREVRRLIVGDYELRYEVTADMVWILRLWHTREDR